MKFKTILCAAVLAAIPSFADVVGSNVCGWMKVDSALKNTIVAVPWVEVRTGNPIAVASLVKTDNLTTGDFLYVYGADGTWYAYVLANSAWVGTTTVGEDGPKNALAATDQRLPRGSAIFLSRQNPDSPFYLYGQYKADGDAAFTVSAGTAAQPVYTLVASPKDAAFDLNGPGKVTGAQQGDSIVVPLDDGASLLYHLGNDGKWGRDVEKTVVTLSGKESVTTEWQEASSIPMGTGFWYVSKGGAATFTW